MELDFRSESPLHFPQIAARTPPRSKLAAGLQNARPKRLLEQFSVSVAHILANSDSYQFSISVAHTFAY